MALISFGGGGDPSNIFASLNREFLQDIEALAVRASSRSNERKDTEDRDMFDQWQNGIVDDEAWLDYISKRVQETVGDPKEHQQWVETQREYVDSISDNKMEFAYENGDATINQLIQYYRGRRDKLDPDSQAYREIVLKLNGFVDKQLSDDIQGGAQDIADRIVTGQATLGDLVSFYRQKLAGTRPNSSLHEQISKEIRDLQSRQIQEDVQVAGSSGGSSGGGRSGGSGRSSGGSSGYGSASAQYNAATASGMIVRDDTVAAALEERDNMGVSALARQFGGTMPGLSEKDSDDYIQGARSHALFMMNQFADDESDSVVFDPQSGEEWENTPDNMKIWAYEYIDLSEMRARGQETGANQDHSNRVGARNDIVEAVRNVQKANAIPFEENYHRLDSEYRRQLQSAEASGDPENILRVNTSFGREFERMGYNAIATPQRQAPRKVAPGVDDTPTIIESQLRGAVDRIPEHLAEESVARGQLLRAYGRGDPNEIMNAQTAYVGLKDHDPDLVDASIDIWDDMDNGDMPTGSSPASLALIAARMRAGEQEGSWLRVYDSNLSGNGVAIVPRVITQSFDPTTGEHVGHGMPLSVNFNPSNGDEWKQIYTDDRNGNPVLTWVIARKEPLPISTFVAGNGLMIRGKPVTNGTVLTESMMGKMTDDEISSQMFAGAIVAGAGPSVLTYSYKYGNRQVKAYWDEDLQGWNTKPYSRYGLNIKNVNGRSVVVLADDGSLGGSIRPFAHINARPVNYHGRNPQKFQAMINSGEVIPAGGWGNYVDGSGEVVLGKENDFRDYWYDDRFVSRQTGMWLNGELVQWADPSFKMERTEGEQRSMLGLSQSRREEKSLGGQRKPQPRGLLDLDIGTEGEESLVGGLGRMLRDFGIFQGDPSKTGRAPNEQNVQSMGFLAGNALSRVQAAQTKRMQQEAAAKALPRITLPRTVGPITNRVDLPMVPRTAPVLPTLAARTPVPVARTDMMTVPRTAPVPTVKRATTITRTASSRYPTIR